MGQHTHGDWVALGAGALLYLIHGKKRDVGTCMSAYASGCVCGVYYGVSSDDLCRSRKRGKCDSLPESWYGGNSGM